MAKLLQMPKLSPTMDEGVLAVWHKKIGDSFAVDDLLAEVETDKATMEFRAFDAGTLLDVLVPAGENVKLGQPVAIVGDPGEDIAALKATVAAGKPAAAPSTTAAAAAPAPAPAPRVEAVEAVRATHVAAPAAPTAPREVFPTLTRTEYAPASAHAATFATNDRPLASPHVRQLAREQSVDLARVRGTGAHGRILPEDLARSAVTPARGSVAPPTAGAAPSERTPLSPMRKTIARRLSESKREVPHFYLRIDLDAAKLVAAREELVSSLAAEAKGGDAPEKPSINDFILCAVSRALVLVPECNASFDGDAILTHKRVDVSVAVAVPEGLVTPVLRNANERSLLAIHREVKRLAAKAKAKKLQPEEMSGGTFSVSNLGMFGIDEFAAVINPPEGAILAVGQVRDEPVVKGGVVVPGKRLAMTLSCDHRVIDGAVGARFLAALRSLLENPVRLLAG
jgi:pyruvate dehydrogenase E2 component (dihydrolipoamide acetyltransferase)